MSQPFQEAIKYKDTQPLDARKKGFGSHDAHKTDEFSMHIATEQYRETLRKEKLLTAESPEVVNAKLTKLLADRAALDSTNRSGNGGTLSRSQLLRQERVHQYDIGRTRITDFDPKAIKDNFYRFDGDNGKEFGNTRKPISCDIGDNAWNITYKPPSHGGKSEVKNFYDKSHLNVSSY